MALPSASGVDTLVTMFAQGWGKDDGAAMTARPVDAYQIISKCARASAVKMGSSSEICAGAVVMTATT